MTNWPDPNKPGYPVNAEKDGWHWLKIGNQTLPQKWTAEHEFWSLNNKTAIGTLGPKWVGKEYEYLGPCIPYADAFTAGARAAREQAVDYLKSESSAVSGSVMRGAWLCAYTDAIQSLPLPNAAPENAANTGENLSANVDLSGLDRMVKKWLDGYEEANGGIASQVVAVVYDFRNEIAKLKGK